MGYCTRYEVEQALANALTQGNPTGGGVIDIISIGKTLSDTVTSDQIAQYIRWADDQIDGIISSIYRIPLSRVNKGTFKLSMDATAGDQSLVMQDASRFTEGDTVVIRQEPYTEENVVLPLASCFPAEPTPPDHFPAPPDNRRLCLWLPLAHSYDLNLARVERIRYPDPIPKISAKLAASFLYDKHFAAQQDPNESEVSKYLRKEAKQELNLILSGAIRLVITDANMLIGRRFYNPAIDDVWSTAAEAGKTYLNEA
jgi:hypothetical protein